VIVVIGGGPAGAVCAARLVQLGKRVLLLEKETFPRFRLGESLLPQSLHVLGAIGALERVRSRFLVKRGAQFHEDATQRTTRFSFSGAFDHRIDYAFQVPRDEFDALLLAHAAERGAEVRHGWTVARALYDGSRAMGVVASDPSGTAHDIEAEFVVDASGRDALFAHEARAIEKIAGLENAAFYTHCRGMPREEGEREGDVHIVLFGDGWHWVIPFKDGRTSIGAVVTRQWLKSRGPGDRAGDLLHRAIAESPAMIRLMGKGEMLWPARTVADFSYRVKTSHGPGWVAIGDAGGFIDPLFSTGVHIAMWGAYEAATAVVGGGLDDWAVRVRAGADMFIDAVLGFYAGTLQKFMFADSPRTYLRRAVTSMLAGDVFGDERWTRDMRERLKTLTG